MRAAAILGPGNVAKSMLAFQRATKVQWTSLIEQADVIVVFGGDGTVHRHLSTFIDMDVPVLVVPCGSGNDFARALGLLKLKDSIDAWRKFANEAVNVRTIDLGVISGLAEKATGSLSRYFCCVAGIGLDSQINKRSNELPAWVRGHGGYALTATREFFRFTPFPMKISNNGNLGQAFRPTMLAAVANAPTYGGGMKIAPLAKLDDGKLDLCIVRSMDLFKLFCLFPTVFFGRHLGFQEVGYEQAEKLRIETEDPFDVYADGEFICQTPVQFSVEPKALKVIAPAQR